jgi:hypothetical protein
VTLCDHIIFWMRHNRRPFVSLPALDWAIAHKAKRTLMEDILETINKLLAILGNVTLREAKTWAETEENARLLRAEGHDDTEGGDA